jgi:membrane fusion protein, multidrug efflux system
MPEALETKIPATAPPEPKSQHAAQPQAAPSQTPAPRKGSKALLVVAFIGALLLIGGIAFYLYAQTYESTDDAMVDCHINNVSSRIAGTLTSVRVDENQFVNQGDVLATIDPRDYRVAVEQAQAQLTQSQADIAAQHPNVPITQVNSETSISTAQAQLDTQQAALAAAEQDLAAARERVAQSQAELREAEANNVKAQADLERYRTLVDKDEIPRTQFDQIVANSKAQAAGVDSAQAIVAVNRASVESAQRIVQEKQAQVAEARSRLAQSDRTAPQQVAVSQATLKSKEAQANVARAGVDKAQLNLSYTQIVAPVSGIVAKRSAEVGATVQPGQQLFTVAQTGDIWITANFKETQLEHMRPGQKVKIHVDAFDQDFNGYVETMPAASGSVMSLLPPENATGNFVKVVQRLPVRIRFKNGQDPDRRLRPGMSVEAKVWVQ